MNLKLLTKMEFKRNKKNKNLVLKGLNIAYLKSRFALVTDEEVLLAKIGYNIADTKNKSEEIKRLEEYARRTQELCST